MKRSTGVWIAIAAAIGAAILVPMFRSDRTAPSGPSGLTGSVAPVFAMIDARGRNTSLSDYRGKIVVMNLWASWCPPCRAEMPDLQRFESDYGRYGVVVVGVNEGESAERAQAFAKSLRITFPIWVDSNQQYGRIYAALGLPTTVVIGADGVVSKGFDGPLSYSQMIAAVKPLAQKK